MAAQVDFKEHEKLLWHMARKVLRRMHAAGAQSTQIEDIFGELTIAWCKARDLWQPEHNVPFGAYLVRGAKLHINRWVANELRQRQMAPFDLDAETSSDGDQVFHDLTPDPNAKRQDDILIDKDLMDYLGDPMRWRNRLAAVSERAGQFIRLLANPPAEVLDIVAGMEMRSEYARSRGLQPGPFPKGVCWSLIFDVMGANKRERTVINEELAHLCRMTRAPRSVIAELFGEKSQ